MFVVMFLIGIIANARFRQQPHCSSSELEVRSAELRNTKAFAVPNSALRTLNFLEARSGNRFFGIKQVARLRGIAFEAGADKPCGERLLKLLAYAQLLAARRQRILANKRAPHRGNLDLGNRISSDL